MEMPHFPKVVILPTFNPLAIWCTRFEFIIAYFKICLCFVIFTQLASRNYFLNSRWVTSLLTMSLNCPFAQWDEILRMQQNSFKITCLATFLFCVSDETFYQIMHSRGVLMGIIVQKLLPHKYVDVVF